MAEIKDVTWIMPQMRTTTKKIRQHRKEGALRTRRGHTTSHGATDSSIFNFFFFMLLFLEPLPHFYWPRYIHVGHPWTSFTIFFDLHCLKSLFYSDSWANKVKSWKHPKKEGNSKLNSENKLINHTIKYINLLKWLPGTQIIYANMTFIRFHLFKPLIQTLLM